jgi:ketosteroid isomerase-like protein
MSQENVEVALKVHRAFSRGDLEGVLSGWHPKAEYRDAIHQSVEGEEGVFRGHDGIRRWWRDLHDHYEDLNTEVLEVRDLGERLVVVFVVRGRGKGSGVALETPLAQVVTMRQGKVVEARDYFSREEALNSVGLQEE